MKNIAKIFNLSQLKVYIFGFINFLLLIALLSLSSCSTGGLPERDMSDRVGFDNSSVIQPPQSRTSQDYYYRQGMPGNMGGNPYGGYGSQSTTPYQYQQPYQQQQYYSPPPPYAAPYQVYPGGGSRYYSNPYSMPPSQYFPQYDADQYYIPPAGVGGDIQQDEFRRR